MTLLSISLPLICIALALWAAVTDYVRREIPDSVAIGLAVSGILHIISTSPYPLLQIGLSVAAALVAGLFFLFSNQGGGDIKMIFGAVIAAGVAFQSFLIGFLTGGGILTLSAWWFGRRAEANGYTRPISDELNPMPRQLSHNLSSREIPFGIAIAVGVIFASVQHLYLSLGG